LVYGFFPIFDSFLARGLFGGFKVGQEGETFFNLLGDTLLCAAFLYKTYFGRRGLKSRLRESNFSGGQSPILGGGLRRNKGFPNTLGG